MLMALLGIIILITSATSFAGGCADVNNSGTVNLQDVAYIINHLYRGGPEFNCGTSYTGVCGNVNGDSKINLMDVAYIINFLYRGGPEPFCGTVTDIDGNTYQAIKIGDQWWMAENLKVTHYRNGEEIPNITDPTTWWSDLTTGAYCEYNNAINNVAVYGRLYNWYAVADSQEIAPVGWRVPTDAEWKQLEMSLGMSQVQADAPGIRGTTEGAKMKEAGTTHWFSPNTGSNESGFSGLPGGYRGSFGTFYHMGSYAYFWSSTEVGSDYAWRRDLNNSSSGVGRYSSVNKHCGFSLRCIKD